MNARSAFFTEFAGSSDSAAPTVMTSMPPKAKATDNRPAAKPPMPCGRKFSVKLDSSTGGVSGHQPSASRAPKTMKRTITATLITLNQNSNSPKPPTAAKLMTVKMTTAISAGIHGAMPNQPPMMLAAPVISAPMTMTSRNHHSQPRTNAAQLPNAWPP